MYKPIELGSEYVLFSFYTAAMAVIVAHLTSFCLAAPLVE